MWAWTIIRVHDTLLYLDISYIKVYTNHHHQEFPLKLFYQQFSHAISSLMPIHHQPNKSCFPFHTQHNKTSFNLIQSSTTQNHNSYTKISKKIYYHKTKITAIMRDTFLKLQTSNWQSNQSNHKIACYEPHVKIWVQSNG